MTVKPIRIDPMIAVGVIDTAADGTWHIGILLTGGDRMLVACEPSGSPILEREPADAVYAAAEAMSDISIRIACPLADIEEDLPR